MGETQAAFDLSAGLEGSVSFGRFESDSLSWEKWSSFSPNRYLEEVEKCATPGSVAQKKAYFEAHFKKIIAARDAELLLDQEKQAENFGSIGSDNPHLEDSVGHEDRISSRVDLFKARKYNERAIQDEEVSGEICRNFDGMEENALQYLPEQVTPEGIPSVEEVKEEVQTGSPVVLLEQPEKDIETHISPKIHDEKPKLNLQKKHQKTNPLKHEEKNAGRSKKELGSIVGKPLRTSTSKATKPSPSRSSTGSGAAPSLTSRKNPPEREKKKSVFPKSLHMSLNLGAPENATTWSSTTRKSVIKGRTGEKDTPKVTLKSFHNSVGKPKSYIEERPPSQKPAPSPATDLRASARVTNQNGSGRPLKPGAAIRQAPHDVSRPSLGSGNNEIQKKLGKNSDSNDAVRARTQSKSKREKELEIQKPRKDLNFKAAPLPSFYRRQSKPMSTLGQDGYKSEILE